MRHYLSIKKFLYTLGILCLMLGLIPAMVFAQDEATPEPPPAEAPAEPPAEAPEEAPAEPVVDITADPVFELPPTQVPEEEAPTEAPVEPVVDIVATPVFELPPTEEAELPDPAVETVVEVEVAEVVEALADADLVLVDANNEVVPLASEEAADILSVRDPMYCPAGLAYGDLGCSPARANMADAIADAAGNGGTIYVESGTFTGFTLTGFNGADLVIVGGTGGGTTSFNSQIYLTDNSANITLRNFTATGSNAGVSGLTLNDTPALIALGNSGTLTLENLIISHDDDTAIYISTQSGDVIMNGVSADGKGNDLGTYVDTTSGTGDVAVFDSTFHAEENDGLQIKSKGSVLLNGVTASDSGGDGADIDNTAGSDNVVVQDSTFKNNKVNGLRVKSDGWIYLSGVTANDNKEIGAYLETTGGGVEVHDSTFNDTNKGESQNYGLQIKHTSGDHTTTICGVQANDNDNEQISLWSPTGTESSSFVYNICDSSTSSGGCGVSEIFIHGGKDWEEVVGTQETCPNGGTPQWHNGLYKCWKHQGSSWYDKGPVVVVNITEDRSNITLNYHDMVGDLWTENFINKQVCTGDDCTTTCAPTCGDGLVQGDEECDGINGLVGHSSCSAKCELVCDNGYTGKDCDKCDTGYFSRLGECVEDHEITFCHVPPGNPENAHSITTDLSAYYQQGHQNHELDYLGECVYVCGNGLKEPGEACDDGNKVDTDACTNKCEAADCGDGIVQTDVEECDDGNEVDTDACTNKCEDADCGDGIVQARVEACDDGNTTAGDGCNATCEDEYCGDGIVNNAGNDYQEACDDGNEVDNDDCTNKCEITGCTDPIALNYDEAATVDDGSCAYDTTTTVLPPAPVVIPVTSAPFIIPVTGLEMKYNLMFIFAGLGCFGFSLVYEGIRRRRKM